MGACQRKLNWRNNARRLRNTSKKRRGTESDWPSVTFARKEGLSIATNVPGGTNAIASWRAVAATNVDAFMRFRCTIARDFLKEMRDFARRIKPGALVTANNSLNSADALFSQCRSYAYNIYEMSQAEDLVVVEDMSSQPRTLPNGRMIEYGASYQELHAISH